MIDSLVTLVVHRAGALKNRWFRVQYCLPASARRGAALRQLQHHPSQPAGPSSPVYGLPVPLICRSAAAVSDELRPCQIFGLQALRSHVVSAASVDGSNSSFRHSFLLGTVPCVSMLLACRRLECVHRWTVRSRRCRAVIARVAAASRLPQRLAPLLCALSQEHSGGCGELWSLVTHSLVHDCRFIGLRISTFWHC